MKRTMLSFVPAVAAAMLIAGSALAAGQQGSNLTISHVVKGCHTWTLAGSAPRVSQTVKLKPGQALTITNNDVMPHQLSKTAGASSFAMKLLKAGVPSTGTLKAPYATGMMPHLGSVLRLTFPKAGVYSFTTKAGEDYMPNVKTVGDDNVLKLKVIVG